MNLTKKIRKYESNYLLNSLRKLAEELGKTPTVYDVRESKYCPNPSTYRDHFGSYVNATKKAGLEPNKKYYTKKELIEYLKNFYINFNRAPRCDKDFGNGNMPSSNMYNKEFGSFNNALKLAGIPITKVQKTYTNKELLTLLKVFAKKLGRTPRRVDLYYDKNMPDPNTYKFRFKSFNRAIKLAGLRINNSKFFYYTNKDLLNLLIKIAKRLGRTPNKYDFKYMRELPSMWIYHKRFGSYTSAVLKAGLRPNKGFPDELAIYWQNHCIEIARLLFKNIKINGGHNKKVGKPDIWVENSKLYIDAKLSLFHAIHIKDQIKRYTIDGYKVQFWCLKKLPSLEIKDKKVKYLYAKNMVKLFRKRLPNELIAKTNQFIDGHFSPFQKNMKEFVI